MIGSIDKLIHEFMVRNIDAASFQELYTSNYRHHRDASVASPKGDWTEGGYYSTIFCLADMYVSEPRYGGELDATALYEAIAKEVDAHCNGQS